MRALLLIPLLALSACDRWKPAHVEPVQQTQVQEAASQASDFSKPMVARGNEPFWSLKIDGTAFTLTRPDQPDRTFTAPGAQVVPGKAVWAAKATNGDALSVSLYVSDCSDGMSDRVYPLTAEVQLGVQTLRGCAAKASELAKASPAS